MVSRFIDALDASNNVVATYEETDDSKNRWHIPTIFPGLVAGQTYNYVMRTPETAGYVFPQLLPIITGVPTISGTIRTGQTLTATAATTENSAGRTWQWRRNGVNIVGATGIAYTLTNLDEGKNITVRQIETNPNGSVNATSAATSVPFLLDQLTATAAAAYSFRKLRGAATLANRMRRADNTEQDFGFAADGAFDQAAFDTFVSASATAHGTTWYDQAVPGVNLIQTTATRQLLAREASANIVNNSKPGFFSSPGVSTNAKWFQRSSFLCAAGAASGFFVMREPTITGIASVMVERLLSAGNGGAGYGIRNENNGDAGFSMANDAGTTLLLTQSLGAGMLQTTPNVLAFRDTGSNLRGFNNGVGGANVNYTRSGVVTLDTMYVGASPTFGATSSGIVFSEIILFTTAISNEDLNTIIASQGGEYGISVTPFLEGEDLEFFGFTRDGTFAEQNQNWQGYTATFSRGDAGLGGSVGYPTIFRRTFKTTSGAANRLNATASDLANFDTYTKDLYIGGTARIYRVTNGVMSLVRSSEITDGKMGRWLWLKPNGDRVVDALTYTHEIFGFARPGVPYWFRVAAVGSNGLAGTWSAPVSFTPANMSGTASGTVNPTKAFNKTGEGGALAAPGSVAVTAGAIAREAVITWAAVSGAEGYVVEFSYYDPADIVSQPYLDLASHATPILSGDLVIIDKELTTFSDDFYASRIFTADKPLAANPMMWFDTEELKRDGNDWTYVAYSGDKPALAVGDHFLRRTAAAGLTATLQRFWHSGSDQTFYNVLKVGTTYRLRIVMRASATVNVSLLLSGASACGISGTTFNSVGTTFTEYTHDMTPTIQPTGTVPYDWRLQFTAGGTPINLDVAYFAIEEVGASSNIMAATPPAVGGYLRDHSFIKPGPNNRSIKRMITNNAYGFRKFYDACVINNVKPWFQIEWNTPQADWVDFVAYLAAPNGSHPMADLRLASGIPEPWTTTFSDMRLEMGNEAWQDGTLQEFWIMPSLTDSGNSTVYSRGNTAGLFWQMISNWMKASPYWTTLEPKLTQHAGGFASSAFGEDAYRYYPDAKEVSMQAYNGGWDNGAAIPTESGLSFNAVLADPMIVQKPRAITRVNALKALCTSLGRTYGTAVRADIYEAGPNYALPGTATAAQAITQEVVMKSRAAATATVDAMLTLAQQDFKSFNYFVIAQGENWSSHAPTFDGAQEYLPHALVRIIHENIAPAKAYGAPMSTFGTKTVALQGGGTSAAFNQVGAYQLRNLANPSKRMLVLVNRNIDPSQLPPADPLYSATPSGSKLFTVQTTWNSATSLKAWTAGIGPYRQHNRYPVGQRRVAGGGLTADPLCVSFNYSPTTLSLPPDLRNITIDASVGATANGLPAGNVLILLFEGVTGG